MQVHRFSFTLALLAGAGAALTGCGSDSSSGGGATTAATTSGNTANPTTSTSTSGATPPRLDAARFVDANTNSRLDQGDVLVVAFDREIAPVTSGADPSSTFLLAVAGDTLGGGAVMQPGPTSREVSVVLGTSPALQVSDPYVPGQHGPGQASGLNLKSGANGIEGPTGLHALPATDFVDIAGTLPSGFFPAGSLNVSRGGHAAVLLDDGRVLVVGGISAGGDYVAEAELYDPLTDAWIVVSDITGDSGKMRRGSVDVRFLHATATKLTDGTVLVCGGFGVEKKKWFGLGGDKVDTLESAFLFDPQAHTFEQVGDMTTPRHSHAATLLKDGRVLISGGYNDSFWRKHNTLAPLEVYDPQTKSFSSFGLDTDEERMGHTATALDGGDSVLMAGGSHYEGGALFGLIKPKHRLSPGAELVRSGRTDPLGDLGAARTDHTAIAYDRDHVLVAGGHDMSAPVGMVEVYDRTAGGWVDVGALTTPRTGVELALQPGAVLIMGGFDGQGEVATVDVYDVAGGAVGAQTLTMNNPRNGFTATRLADGRTLIAGGLVGGRKGVQSLDGNAIADCELYTRQ